MALNNNRSLSFQIMADGVCEPLLDKMPLEIKTMIVKYVSFVCKDSYWNENLRSNIFL